MATAIGKEGHQNHDQHFRQQAKAEPDDQQGGDGENLDRLGGDEKRIKSTTQEAAEVHRRSDHATPKTNAIARPRIVSSIVAPMALASAAKRVSMPARITSAGAGRIKAESPLVITHDLPYCDDEGDQQYRW